MENRNDLLSALTVGFVALLVALGIVEALRAPVIIDTPVVVAQDLPTDDGLEAFAIDSWAAGDGAPHAFATTQDPVLPRAPYIRVQGWAFNGPQRADDALVAVIDGVTYLHADWRLPRPDVATSVGSAALDSGYIVVLNTTKLAKGVHTIRLGVVSPMQSVIHLGTPKSFLVP